MNKKLLIVLVCVLILVIVAGVFFFFNKNSKEYTVTFEISDGVVEQKQLVKEGEKVKEPKEPTREGYVFVGWFNGNSKFDFNTKVDKDITLIAKWDEESDKITRISIISSKSELTVGEEHTLSFQVTPGNISTEGKEIKWFSSNEDVVSVDSNGKIKALKGGVSNITVEIDGMKSTIGIKVTGKDNTQTETNRSKTSNKSSNTSKQTNTNTTEETITYSYTWEDVGSVVGQKRLYVVSSKGEKVEGTVTLKSTDGDTETVTIPATGKLFNEKDIASVTNIQKK